MNFKIVCLCGSTKFKKEYEETEKQMTLSGCIVLTCGLFAHADNIVLDSKTKNMVDKMHKQKIDMADEIYIINVGGYVGDSTKDEIKYARERNKPIKYLETHIPKVSSRNQNHCTDEPYQYDWSR